MRLILLICLVMLGACSQPSAGIDWDDWLEYQKIRGNMRPERSAADASFSNDTLVRNFRTIAFDVEEDPFGLGPLPEEERVPPILRKWQDPIAYRIVSTDENLQPRRETVELFMKRLASLTGLTIRKESETEPLDEDGRTFNLSIMILTDDEFARLGAFDSFDRPDWSEGEAEAVRSILETVREWYTAPSPCAGTFYYGPEDGADDYGALSFGLVMVRADLPEALFDSCVEEELTQMMGLFNDDDDVRPSLFNDINEFALMTDHDEYLLRALYDERLKPGMSPDQAMPLVRQIIAELRPSG